MHKPDKPMDPIEEVENILKRLAPSAMSERATRANESMIDGLAGSQSAVLKQPARRQYWWQAGIAASLMAGAGLVFWDQPKVDWQGEYDFLNNKVGSIEPTSAEMWFDQDDGNSCLAVSYLKEDINEIRDKRSGLVIQTGWREEGNVLEETTEF
ncbi:MAG: hypothetical protein B9S30_04225 [Verrucomicrobiia bacterium Tous-C5FEB]|jgi:hypothetical protein|nr:MAG: hypothetical protein B9S30_04225 [Verrucomicrobiae bacterium Tous-C5FEB]